MDIYHWDVLLTYHWDTVKCFIWDLFQALMRRCCFVPLRRCNDVLVRCCKDVPLTDLGNAPPRRRWIFYLRCSCDGAGTYRETSLRCCYDVLMSGGNFCDLDVSEDVAKRETFTIIPIDSLLAYENKFHLQVYLDNCVIKL